MEDLQKDLKSLIRGFIVYLYPPVLIVIEYSLQKRGLFHMYVKRYNYFTYIMIEYILLKVKQPVDHVVIPLLKKSEDHGFLYIIPKLKKVPKKRLTRYIVQQIYDNPAPDSILYSKFIYSYHHNADVIALRDIAVILNRPVEIIDKYTIRDRRQFIYYRCG